MGNSTIFFLKKKGLGMEGEKKKGRKGGEGEDAGSAAPELAGSRVPGKALPGLGGGSPTCSAVRPGRAGPGQSGPAAAPLPAPGG